MLLKEFDSLEVISFKDCKHEFKNHFHETYVISIIEKGTLKENNFFGTTGSILISHPYEVHENKLFDNSDHSFTSFYINPDVIQHIGKRQNISFNDKVIDDQALFTYFMQFRFALESSNFNTNVSLYKGLHQLIASHGNNDMFKHRDQPSYLAEILNFINRNCHEKIRLDDLAKQSKLNKYSFIRQFKDSLGITPFEYINLQRTTHAKKLLREGVPIIDTALSTGFYDQSHFNKYFKRYIGLNPLEYLRSCNILLDFDKLSS